MYCINKDLCAVRDYLNTQTCISGNKRRNLMTCAGLKEHLICALVQACLKIKIRSGMNVPPTQDGFTHHQAPLINEHTVDIFNVKLYRFMP